MAPDWSFEHEGETFKPVPESWISAPTAVDHDEDAPRSAVRLYAVSAALIGSRCFRVRYIHPKGTKVKQLETPATQRPDGEGYYPNGLETGSGWERSYVPSASQTPDDLGRLPELAHLRTLWGSRVSEVPTDDETKRKIADGGSAVGMFDDVPGGGR